MGISLDHWCIWHSALPECLHIVVLTKGGCAIDIFENFISVRLPRMPRGRGGMHFIFRVNNLFGLNSFPGCFGFVKCVEIGGQSQQGVDDGGRTYEASPGEHY